LKTLLDKPEHASQSDSSLTVSSNTAFEQKLVDLSIDKVFDRVRRLLALQHGGDVFGEPILQVRKIVSRIGRAPATGSASMNDGYNRDEQIVQCIACRQSLPLCVERNLVSKSASKTVSCETSSLPTALPIDWASFSRCRGIIPCGQTVIPKA
jgi:hypothetical protein